MNIRTRVRISGFHLITLPANHQVPFKGIENIVFRPGPVNPFTGPPASLAAGGSGDLEVAQLIRAMD
jgi:hypothetical protein